MYKVISLSGENRNLSFVLIHSIFPPEIQYQLASSFWVSLVLFVWGIHDLNNQIKLIILKWESKS